MTGPLETAKVPAQVLGDEGRSSVKGGSFGRDLRIIKRIKRALLRPVPRICRVRVYGGLFGIISGFVDRFRFDFGFIN